MARKKQMTYTDFSKLSKEELRELSFKKDYLGRYTYWARLAQERLYDEEHVGTYDGLRPKRAKSLDWYDNAGRNGEGH